MNTLSNSSPFARPGVSRLQQLVLESAITLRNCALSYWITEEERHAWRSHMRTEALRWRHLTQSGGTAVSGNA